MHKIQEASEMLVTTPNLTTSVVADFPCEHRYIFCLFYGIQPFFPLLFLGVMFN